MELRIFPVNRQEVQETWLRTLTANDPFSRHRILIALGNLWCLLGLANLCKYAYLKGTSVSAISVAMVAALILQAHGGYYAFLLFRFMRKVLGNGSPHTTPEDLLTVSYLGLRLYLTLLTGFGCVAMLVPAFLKF